MVVKSYRIFFSVGEPSGDLHTSNLIRELQKLSPQNEFRGFGGPRMQASGCKLDFDLTSMAVMGIVEVLPKVREFLRVADIASRIFEKERPDAVVLVDFPGFNWHIAKRAKEREIPVYYYLPPQLWAWAGWRIRKMRRSVDHVFCNLPFEHAWYTQRRMPASYVGHPFFDEVFDRPLDQRFLERWRASAEGVQVAVLPGSRSREVQSIWPMQLAAIRELSRQHPGTRFLVACLKDQHCLWCQKQLIATDVDLNVEFFVGKTSEVIELADCSLMKSGSVSLELMARGTPAVVVYHVGRVFYAVAKRLATVDSFSLPNLIAGRAIIPEYLAVGQQTEETIANSVIAMDRLIGDATWRSEQREELVALSRQLANSGASRTAAAGILRQLELARYAQNSASSYQAEPTARSVEAA